MVDSKSDFPKRKIRVVQVIANLDMGGGQHVVYELVRNLDKEIFDVTTICFHRVKRKENSLLQEKMLSEGCKVIFCSWPREFSCFQMWRHLSKLKPDVVHCHLTPLTAILWSKVHSVKCLQTIHTSPEKALPKKWQNWIFSKMVKKGLVVPCAISEYNQELCSSYWNVPKEKILSVNNGISIEKFSRKSHEGFAFINVARQDENKNQMLILTVFSKFTQNHTDEDVLLYLIGDGPENPRLRVASKEFGVETKVIFTGYIENPTLYLSVSDVYISSANREGLSLSVLEGMACGLPVIATDAGGVRDLAQDNGILIPVGDEEAMLDAMETLFFDKELWAKKSAFSLKKVYEFSVEKMIAGYVDIYEKMAARQI